MAFLIYSSWIDLLAAVLLINSYLRAAAEYLDYLSNLATTTLSIQLDQAINPVNNMG